MAIPTSTAWDVGVNPTTTILNARIRDAINFLKNPPMAIMRRTTNQALSNTFADSVKWTSEDKDSDNGHSLVTNTERYTVQTAGIYYLTSTVIFSGNINGQRDAYFRLNGDSTRRWGWLSRVPTSGGADTCMPIQTHMRLIVGDWVEVIVYQDSGVSLNINGGTQDPRFDILWVAR